MINKVELGQLDLRWKKLFCRTNFTKKEKFSGHILNDRLIMYGGNTNNKKTNELQVIPIDKM